MAGKPAISPDLMPGERLHDPRDVSPSQIRAQELHNGTMARSFCRVIAEFKGLLISGRQDRPEIESGGRGMPGD
jgi:hypothetical protein